VPRIGMHQLESYRNRSCLSPRNGVPMMERRGRVAPGGTFEGGHFQGEAAKMEIVNCPAMKGCFCFLFRSND